MNEQIQNRINLLESRNKLVMQKAFEKSPANKNVKESIKREFKIDVDQFDFNSPIFSWTDLREGTYKAVQKLCESGRLSEAQSETAFGQVLRAGIINIANNWYILAKTVHEQIVQMTTSNKFEELYAPFHRVSPPSPVEKGQNFPESKFTGLDVKIKNVKFGNVVAFERELFDDDQTGQVSQRASDFGEGMRLLYNAWTAQRFIGTAGTYGDHTIPASETYSQLWYPLSAPMTGGGYNRPASYAVFNQNSLIEAINALKQQKDLSGNKLMVDPDTIYLGTANGEQARQLMNSSFYVSTESIKTGTVGGTDSKIGAVHSDNPLKGRFNVVEDRFLPNTAWALGMAGKGMVFQVRDPLEIIQENPQSGYAFTVDSYRFRSRSRFGVDWIDPRFWWLGNDGTAT